MCARLPPNESPDLIALWSHFALDDSIRRRRRRRRSRRAELWGLHGQTSWPQRAAGRTCASSYLLRLRLSYLVARSLTLARHQK